MIKDKFYCVKNIFLCVKGVFPLIPYRFHKQKTPVNGSFAGYELKGVFLFEILSPWHRDGISSHGLSGGVMPQKPVPGPQ